MADVKTLSDHELIEELRARGIVPCTWNVEDARTTIEQDNGSEDLTEEQADQAARILLDRVGSGLLDILGERGNAYLDDRWAELSSEILAEVRAAPAP